LANSALIFMMGAAEEFALSAGGVIPAPPHILNQTYSFLMNFMDN
jgi:hypothetical protein